jgi:rhodanese-related sulfurtransferase
LLEKLSKIFILIFLLSSLQACGQQKVENKAYQVMLQGLLGHSVEEVTVPEVLMLDSNTIYLDAREKVEFEVSHLKNAIWVGYDDFNLNRVKDLNKDAKVVVYCSVGYRSEKVAEKLKDNGFENVSNLYGGIFEWKNEDLPIVNTDGEVTDSIHAFDKTWGIWLRNGVKVYNVK